MKTTKSYYNVILLYEIDYYLKAIKMIVIKSKMKRKKEKPIKVD